MAPLAAEMQQRAGCACPGGQRPCTREMGFGTMRTGFGTMSVMIITLDVDGDLPNADVGGGADCGRPDHVRYPNEVSP